MLELLSSNVWQGIGVLASLAISCCGFIFGFLLKRNIFKTKNSQFESFHETTKEVLEGQSIVFFGRVRDEVFPGPPNYRSINNGDIPQFFWILYTNTPISIIGHTLEDPKPHDLGKSCSFQLSVSSEIYDNKSDILGKFVKVSGRVFVGRTGHHRTKALIEVASINIL